MEKVLTNGGSDIWPIRGLAYTQISLMYHTGEAGGSLELLSSKHNNMNNTGSSDYIAEECFKTCQ